MILHNFIVMEGIDGSGTSTQISLLSGKLPPERVFFTCEPTGLETGIFLRKMLRGEIRVQPATAAYLFAADRCEHVYGANGIAEQAKNGKLVICDRYIFSSLAYQSAECGSELPRKLNSDFPLPELTFFFDIDPALSLKRIESRVVTEIYEKSAFLTKTAENYRAVFNEYKKTPGMTVVTIDASRSIAETESLIWSHIRGLLQKKTSNADT